MVDVRLKPTAAIALLHGFLELRELTPNFDDWTEARLFNNPPRLVRLRQLISLFQALNVPWNLPDFIEGTFIAPHDAHYVTALAQNSIWNQLGLNPDVIAKKSRAAVFCFRELLEYRQLVESALNYTRFPAEGSLFAMKIIEQADDLNCLIENNVLTIDRILGAFIDPQSKVFTIQLLVEKFGFPDVDLSRIDLESF